MPFLSGIIVFPGSVRGKGILQWKSSGIGNFD